MKIFVGLVCLILFPYSAFAQTSGSYRKSTEGDEVVRNKLYPKEKKIELNLPNFGYIMNQSYLSTIVTGGGVSYFFSEAWGINFDFMYAINQNKDERTCLETFINNFTYSVTGAECSSQNPDAQSAVESKSKNSKGKRNANYGPAYVPIRELQYVLTANATWNPVYGKQLSFLTFTNYFDLFVNFGGGLAFSNYYPMATTLKNGKATRGSQATDSGADASESNSYGDAGRPTPENQTNVVLNLAVGQKFHFANRFSLKAEVKNFTLLGTPQGFDNFFAIVGGLGLRF